MSLFISLYLSSDDEASDLFSEEQLSLQISNKNHYRELSVQNKFNRFKIAYKYEEGLCNFLNTNLKLIKESTFLADEDGRKCLLEPGLQTPSKSPPLSTSEDSPFASPNRSRKDSSSPSRESCSPLRIPSTPKNESSPFQIRHSPLYDESESSDDDDDDRPKYSGVGSFISLLRERRSGGSILINKEESDRKESSYTLPASVSSNHSSSTESFHSDDMSPQLQTDACEFSNNASLLSETTSSPKFSNAESFRQVPTDTTRKDIDLLSDSKSVPKLLRAEPVNDAISQTTPEVATLFSTNSENSSPQSKDNSFSPHLNIEKARKAAHEASTDVFLSGIVHSPKLVKTEPITTSESSVNITRPHVVRRLSKDQEHSSSQSKENSLTHVNSTTNIKVEPPAEETTLGSNQPNSQDDIKLFDIKDIELSMQQPRVASDQFKTSKAKENPLKSYKIPKKSKGSPPLPIEGDNLSCASSSSQPSKIKENSQTPSNISEKVDIKAGKKKSRWEEISNESNVGAQSDSSHAKFSKEKYSKKDKGCLKSSKHDASSDRKRTSSQKEHSKESSGSQKKKSKEQNSNSDFNKENSIENKERLKKNKSFQGEQLTSELSQESEKLEQTSSHNSKSNSNVSSTCGVSNCNSPIQKHKRKHPQQQPLCDQLKKKIKVEPLNEEAEETPNSVKEVSTEDDLAFRNPSPKIDTKPDLEALKSDSKKCRIKLEDKEKPASNKATADLRNSLVTYTKKVLISHQISFDNGEEYKCLADFCIMTNVVNLKKTSYENPNLMIWKENLMRYLCTQAELEDREIENLVNLYLNDPIKEFLSSLRLSLKRKKLPSFK